MVYRDELREIIIIRCGVYRDGVREIIILGGGVYRGWSERDYYY